MNRARLTLGSCQMYMKPKPNSNFTLHQSPYTLNYLLHHHYINPHKTSHMSEIAFG